MTPAVGWTENAYWQARRSCHRAWVDTQPQYVIPGVLDAADAGAVRCVEPAPRLATGDGARPESPSGPTRPLYTHNGHDALPSESARRGRKEATP